MLISKKVLSSVNQGLIVIIVIIRPKLGPKIDLIRVGQNTSYLWSVVWPWSPFYQILLVVVLD